MACVCGAFVAQQMQIRGVGAKVRYLAARRERRRKARTLLGLRPSRVCEPRLESETSRVRDWCGACLARNSPQRQEVAAAKESKNCCSHLGAASCADQSNISISGKAAQNKHRKSEPKIISRLQDCLFVCCNCAENKSKLAAKAQNKRKTSAKPKRREKLTTQSRDLRIA